MRASTRPSSRATQTPWQRSSESDIANSRHSSFTGQSAQKARAASTFSPRAGMNSSGSAPRQRASRRHARSACDSDPRRRRVGSRSSPASSALGQRIPAAARQLDERSPRLGFDGVERLDIGVTLEDELVAHRIAVVRDSLLRGFRCVRTAPAATTSPPYRSARGPSLLGFRRPQLVDEIRRLAEALINRASGFGLLTHVVVLSAAKQA
jgi:hypothetical protein